MLFNSLHFLVFLPVVLVLYYLLKHQYRWVLLFVASSYFYSVFYPPYLLILYAIILVDYSAGLGMERTTGFPRKLILLVSIVANIGLLSYFKYYNFFIDAANDTYAALGWEGNFKHLAIILPIGLSFHTFQSLSYTIEVYWKRQKAERHIGYFANYVLFFPQMVAGPIERYASLGEQLHIKQVLNYDNIANGLRLILYGLFIKMCVADNLAPLANQLYSNPGNVTTASTWIGLVAFAIQIYADFYGYSTIAIGAGRCMGIKMMDNFRQPYFATGIQSFWQRWHISLSTWFRDYVYIPLGGSRVSTARWMLNILAVFALSGFWHGANYTFIIWGLAHATLYFIEYFLHKTPLLPFTKTFSGRAIGGVITFTAVTLVWVFFRAADMTQAKLVFESAFGIAQTAEVIIEPTLWQLLPVAVFIVFEALIYGKRFEEWAGSYSVAIRWSTYAILAFCIVLFSGIQTYPFIYFQF
ncbi:MAG: MBOAT family protein [Sphingobacteriales bacterium JAD_PAG50586_3]|nr:MAG: MBOAT family protein [Sphingobacteriales bacterium JAD_PAG50586_3]